MAPDDTEPLSEEARRLHFLSRFTLGQTPALREEVRGTGVLPWLDAQLEDDGTPPEALAERLARLPTLAMSKAEILDRYDVQGETRYVPADELRERILLLAVHGSQVREVAADFFRNHFTVSIDKARVRFYATDYERVLHARVFGSFHELLRTSARHPAMLVYLDNAVSRRPLSKAELKHIEIRERLAADSKEAGRRASDLAAQRGLNENYARELLELHTLGVDNGYDQSDVESVARALTGWTISPPGAEEIVFEFRPEMHCDGDKRVLNRVIEDDWKDPEREGEEVLAFLAAHDHTADHLAFKLYRHLVHDDPEPGMVKRIAKVFRRSDGDLKTVYRAIATDPEFFAPRNAGAKYKRPFELVVSALRATGAEIAHTRGLLRGLAQMDEPLLECKDPTGYYDQAEAWLDPGAPAVRWKFALDLALGRLDGVRVPDAFFEEALDDERPLPDALLARLLPASAEPRLVQRLDEIAADRDAAGWRSWRELAALLTGMILGSAGFQRQ